MIKRLTSNKLLISALYCLPFLLTIDSWERIVLFIAGVFLGVATLLLDENYVAKYYNEEFNKSSQTESLSLGNSSSKDLISRSTLFLLLLVPLSFFIVTSTRGALGRGYILGLILGIVQEMWQLKNDIKTFRSRFLSQLKKNLSNVQVELLVLITTGYFLLISIWSALMK